MAGNKSQANKDAQVILDAHRRKMLALQAEVQQIAQTKAAALQAATVSALTASAARQGFKPNIYTAGRTMTLRDVPDVTSLSMSNVK
jgi:hypothetical protein